MGDLERGPWPDHVPVPTFGPRMVCTRCGIVGADARPNWLEPPPETLTGCNGGERRGVIRIKAPVFCRAYLI
jgi:hypothetical protein